MRSNSDARAQSSSPAPATTAGTSAVQCDVQRLFHRAANRLPLVRLNLPLFAIEVVQDM